MSTPVARSKPLPSTTAPSRHVYDVIVLGSQLGGALAAALLAKRGYSVLLVEHDGTGPGYEHDGYVLPYAPFVAPALKTMPAVEESFTELSLTAALQRNLQPHSPELQLVMPRHRVDLHTDAARRRAELVREFDADAERILADLTATALQHEPSDAFLKQGPPLPPDGILESWNLKKRVGQHPGLQTEPRLAGEDEPSKLLRGLLPFVVHLDQPASPLARTRPLSQALQSPWRYPGGRDGLRKLLFERLVELGGDLLSPENTDTYVVEELHFEGGRFSAVKLLRSDTLYRASCLVSATDAGALRRLITDRKKHRGLSEQLDLSTLKSFLFAVNWVVPEAVLPRGMGELLLMDTQDAELGPLLVQQHPARTPEGKEDPALRVICAGGFVPASVRDLGEGYLQSLAMRIDAHLDALMPFTKDKRLLRSAPYLDAGAVRGSRLMPHPHYVFDTEAVLGVSGLKQHTPTKNLLLAGREVLPGLGLEGEFLAGARAVRLVQEMMKKKAVLKR
ncbi:MAG TPA: NAD(P)-binding protein [Archangium sp.]|uniref:NAD(P)-binding protein n=1 Tax=Archangium sp. TaxID=1872627 RepID=UPI002E3620B6|nr:NAD(P)-binding protein [Archangium sp.]HEX5746384.1 NAD(P)-binding protein [Archangium sp.]